MRRREFITLFGSVAAWPIAARAQHDGRMRRIAVLVGNAQDHEMEPMVAALREELGKLGWTEGRSIEIELRWGSGDYDRIQRYAAELVALKLDLILAQNTPAVAALQRATRSTPIVFVNVSDPVGSGFVETLARPGRNITGFSNFEPSMGGKWLELIRDIAPQVTRVALLSNPDTSPQSRSYLPFIESAARAHGLQTVPTPVRDISEIDRIIAALAKDPHNGLILLSDSFTWVNREGVVRSANQHRVPTVYPFREFVKAGGLLSYGVYQIEQWPRAATYIDRILKGEEPADLPVQQPTKFELLINLKTAKALGLTVPVILQMTADEVIE